MNRTANYWTVLCVLVWIHGILFGLGIGSAVWGK